MHTALKTSSLAFVPEESEIEVIDSKELARRLSLPESWVREHVRSRSDDPLPHVKVGRYVRFEWGRPELVQWWARHRVSKQGRNGGEP